MRSALLSLSLQDADQQWMRWLGGLDCCLVAMLDRRCVDEWGQEQYGLKGTSAVCRVMARSLG